jgi:hypothetical protein|tara:strand:- start:692 stop:814 length:123 start_codon:yes stop_codon:yes gene_type:complete
MIDKQLQKDLYILISIALFFMERDAIIEILVFIYFFLMSF